MADGRRASATLAHGWRGAALAPLFCVACGDAAAGHGDHAGGTSSAASATQDAASADGFSGVAATAKTTSGAYTVELSGPLTVLVGTQLVLWAKIRDTAGQPLAGPEPVVQFVHAGMGHGGAKTPLATSQGGGVYRIDGLQPSMAGTWQLTLQISGGSPSGSDKVQFTVTAK